MDEEKDLLEEETSTEEDSQDDVSYWKQRALEEAEARKKAEAVIVAEKREARSKKQAIADKLLSNNKKPDDSDLTSRLTALEQTQNILSVKNRTGWRDETIEELTKTIGRQLSEEDIKNPMIAAAARAKEEELNQRENTPGGRGVSYSKVLASKEGSTAVEQKKAFSEYFTKKINKKNR